MSLERTPFDQHLTEVQWRQGEHVFISGPTGSGKTTLATSLLEKRSHVIGFAVKAKDKTLTQEYSDWSFVEDISEIEGWMNRVMLWVRPKRKETADEWKSRQSVAFKRAFDVLLKSGGWCVFVDELAYMSNPKFGGVGSQIEMMHYIGRSAGLSVLSLAQRPTFVPLAVISNASHAYVAQTHMGEDLKRLANLGGVNANKLAQEVSGLDSRHDFVYIPSLVQGSQTIVNTRR